MSFQLRSRTVAYDNISVGNATGRERTTGQTPSTEATGGGYGSSTDPVGATSSTGGMQHSRLKLGTTDPTNTSDPLDNIAVGEVTLRGERLG